jgi:hypothetical protein
MLRLMTQSIFNFSEHSAARHAARYLETGDPQRALSLLREVRLKPADLPPDASSEDREIQRLRTYIERAIEEMEIHYPGHALRTLRIAVGRAPLG